MRIPVVVANWKMNKTVGQSLHFLEVFFHGWDDDLRVEVIISPPFTSLLPVRHTIGKRKLGLAAQDVFWEDEGAFTGEVSPVMLKDVGCTHVIIGHSERRHYFHETDEWVRKKISAALKEKLVPIVCIGETLEERNEGKTLDIVRKQTQNGLRGLNCEEIKNIIIAYEPTWAIGTGMNATPEAAQEAHAYIRKVLSEVFGKGVSDEMRIVYGGSVSPANAFQISQGPDVDGLLVGGASLKPDTFSEIVSMVRKAKGG